MDAVCRNISKLKDRNSISLLEKEYNCKLPHEVVEFFLKNNGGVPLKKEVVISNKEYEVRCFLSFNSGEYNSIDKPAKAFQEQTNGKIIPLGKDSGDNYYCLNVETGKIYYWDREDNQYVCLAEDFKHFIEIFQ